MSTDEVTGVHALEPTHPDLPTAPRLVRRRDDESIGQGTPSFMRNRDVVSGPVVAPAAGPTRTAEDFAAPSARPSAPAPAAPAWHFVVDNLNTHQAETLVRLVAARCGITDDLGVKGQRGVLKSMRRRAAFVAAPSHRIVFHFHDTPTHASWMNQIEIWLSILARKLLKWGIFPCPDDLTRQVLAFIAYYNRTMAKPFKWTDQGTALTA